MHISIKRLFGYFTVISLAMGAMIWFPDGVQYALDVVKLLLLVSPVIAACVFWSLKSPRPRTTLFTACFGGLIGLFYSPLGRALLRYYYCEFRGWPASWTGTDIGFQSEVIPMTVTAFVSGLLSWSIAKYQREDREEEMVD